MSDPVPLPPVVLQHDDHDEILLFGVGGVDAHVIGPPGAASMFRSTIKTTGDADEHQQ